jgi:hypothetical protein
VQCFDNGPAEGRHAHTRYVLKVTWTAAAAGALVGEDKRALSQTRYVRLCVAKAFVKNCRRKAERHALDAAEHATVARLVALMAQITAVAPEGAPEPLIGAPFTRLRGEGVLRTPRNFALMSWQPTAEGGGFLPVVLLVARGRGESADHELVVELGVPSGTNQDGSRRKATASAYYGAWKSPEYERLLSAKPDEVLRENLARMAAKSAEKRAAA